MATTSLQQAMASIGRLPAAVQDDVAQQLTLYAKQWSALRDGVAEGRNDIEAGRVTGISSIEGFVDNLCRDDERS